MRSFKWNLVWGWKVSWEFSTNRMRKKRDFLAVARAISWDGIKFFFCVGFILFLAWRMANSFLLISFSKEFRLLWNFVDIHIRRMNHCMSLFSFSYFKLKNHNSIINSLHFCRFNSQKVDWVSRGGFNTSRSITFCRFSWMEKKTFSFQ